VKRCEWVGNNPLYIAYHDKEWGTPIYDDQKLFEFLILEGAQAGLSWFTILKKREEYRKAFDNFTVHKIAKYDAKKIELLLNNQGIIRNRLKITAAIQNAKVFLGVQEQYGNFSDYIWKFVDGKPKVNYWKNIHELPVKTKESEAMSKELRKWGFNFVGPTICYAFMQAVGMVNDHTVDCFRHQELILT
jgi:DNA-3-methyladenine glycosylase I